MASSPLPCSLNEDNNRRLRSGLKTDVYVMNAVKEDVMRIANASYYVGRGEYELFVRNSDKEIVKRKVQLGDSNFEFVEVVSGLQPGDEVVVSDMSNYKNKNKLKLKMIKVYLKQAWELLKQNKTVQHALHCGYGAGHCHDNDYGGGVLCEDCARLSRGKPHEYALPQQFKIHAGKRQQYQDHAMGCFLQGTARLVLSRRECSCRFSRAA